MSSEQFLRELNNLTSEIRLNTEITSRVEDTLKGQIQRTDKLVDMSNDFRVFIADQNQVNKRVESKVNGISVNHQTFMENMPKSLRKELYGEINKLDARVKLVESSHTEESTDKRRTWLEILKHGVTAGIAYVLAKL